MAQKQRSVEATSSYAPIVNVEERDAIIKTISKLEYDDLLRFGAWQSLDELSRQTILEGVEPNPDGLFNVGKDKFEAVANVYVTLNYGGKDDRSSLSDSYPLRVIGEINRKNMNVKIVEVTVDTSSFYE